MTERPRRDAPIARSAGVDTRDAVPERDPFEAFDRLMELVEALLPRETRPPRRPTVGRFLL